MTRFRPCIDLHDGTVKQIVGGSLRDHGPGPTTNFVAAPDQDPAWFARRYRADDLTGGHVIKLGPGNDDAARAALAAWPGGLQLGGGITAANAEEWLDAGAAKVIVTSWLFVDGQLNHDRLRALAATTGRKRLVIDLSCRRCNDGWHVATDRWQTVTDTVICPELLAALADRCSEFLIHAADVEGRCQGIDEALVSALADWSPLPTTYAGGGRQFADLARVATLSHGRIDMTFGSALDLFGGDLVRYRDCVEWNRTHA